MKNKEYLNEKEYKKINIFLIILGILLFGGGVALLVPSILKYQSITDVWSKSAFDSQTSAMFTGFGGVVLILLGIVVILIPFKRKIMAYNAQQVMPVAQEGIEKLGPSIGKVAGDIAKEVNKENK